MKVVIVSSGRANKQITLSALPTLTGRELEVLVHEREASAYLNALGNRAAVRTHRCERIAKIREFAVREMVDVDDGKILMLDDDLKFYRRRRKDPNFDAVTDAWNLVRDVREVLDDYAHVGVLDKFMSQHAPRENVVGRRYNQVLGYNLRLGNPRFDCVINEEHYAHLDLVAEQGLPGLVLTNWSKSSRAYAPGGCSAWRTPEIERNGHEELARKFPDYVKTVPHESSPSGVAIRVNWRKLYENVR